MKRLRKAIKGNTLVTVLAGVTILGLTSAALIEQANSVGIVSREANSRLQEDAFTAYQQEFALAGTDPATVSSNPVPGDSTVEVVPVQTITYESVLVTPATDPYFDPVSGALIPGSPAVYEDRPVVQTTYEERRTTSGMPTLLVNSSGGSVRPGSATVVSYSTLQNVSRKASALQIMSTGASAVPVTATPLNPPTFNYSGLIDEATFAANPSLAGFLTPASNPSGTVIRYTIDGTDPIDSSPLWSSSAGFNPGVPPQVVKAAAFNSDVTFARSPIASANFSRSLAVTFSREGPALTNPLAVQYKQIVDGTNRLQLSVQNAPSNTHIFYTTDGSTPTASSAEYAGAFHVPAEEWSVSGLVLNALVVTPYSNITGTVTTTNLVPDKVKLPSPTFGSFQTVSGGYRVRISVDAPADFARIRYSIGGTLTASSPTIDNGGEVFIPEE